jgi:hypothetical protein
MIPTFHSKTLSSVKLIRNPGIGDLNSSLNWRWSVVAAEFIVVFVTEDRLRIGWRKAIELRHSIFRCRIAQLSSYILAMTWMLI